MFEDEWDKIMAKYTEIDACFILNSKHKGLEAELYKRGIKRIPIVYSPYVEEDKCYMVTDKEIVEHIKQTVCFEFNKECEEKYE